MPSGAWGSVPLDARSSTGKSLMMLIATAMPPSDTPRKFQKPDQITACVGLSERV